MIGVVGCLGDHRSKHVVDLIEVFPEARISAETDVIDFQDPSVKGLLGSGWVLPKEEPGARGLAWGIGTQSEMMFFRLQPEPLTLTFRCRPHRFEDRRSQSVSFFVNGHLVDEADLRNGMQDIDVEVPAELLRSGENSVTMTYAESQSREVAFSKPGRDYAVAWSQLTIRPSVVGSDASPSIDAEARTLFIPFGTRVDFFLDAVDQGEFSAEGMSISGSDVGRLIVSSQVGEAGESVVGNLNGGPDKVRVVISGDEVGPVRLSLAALGQRSRPCDGPCGIVLSGPIVDSIGSLAVAEGAYAADSGAESSSSDRPNVVVYLIDALRADHLGCYGYQHPVSPHIDQFAEQAILFERAQAQTSWTRASVASIFTGLMPQVHSANDDDDALSESVTTIAEFLRTSGYQTGGFTANGNAGPNVGFAQGFDVFQHFGAARSEALNSEALSWLQGLAEDRPFFLWLHAVDPHEPYMPPDDLRRRFAPMVTDPDLGSVARVLSITRNSEVLTEGMISDLLSLYDAEIAANDRSLGALLGELRARGLYDDTLIIVVSDHGEEFYDHGGWTHGKTLYAEQLDIPLIVKLPGIRAGERISQVVQHVDILPTILDVVGLGRPMGIQGKSLMALLLEEGRQRWKNRSFSSLDLRGRIGSSVYDGHWKMIRLDDRRRGSSAKLYDKRVDWEETVDLSSGLPDRIATMLTMDCSHSQRLPEPLTAPVVDTTAKEEMRESLRALGYIE